jgi:hypothetical protein
MCPNCHRALAYPLKQCSGGRCPFCGYKPGDKDRRARAEGDRADSMELLDYLAKNPRREERPPDIPRKATEPRYELMESKEDSLTHAVHRNRYTVCGSYTGETFSLLDMLFGKETAWRPMGKGFPSCSRCQRLLGIGQR